MEVEIGVVEVVMILVEVISSRDPPGRCLMGFSPFFLDVLLLSLSPYLTWL